MAQWQASARDLGRREFLKASGLGAAAACVPAVSPAGDEPSARKLKAAAIVTEFTYRSHAHVILENFLEPYLFNGKRIDSGMEVASLYLDQVPGNDMGREVAKEYKFPIH